MVCDPVPGVLGLLHGLLQRVPAFGWALLADACELKNRSRTEKKVRVGNLKSKYGLSF